MSTSLVLRVLTFNIHGGRPAVGGEDLEGTAAAIRALQPDLVGLQEVHRWPWPHPQRFQPDRLQRLLGLEVQFRHSLGLGPFGYGNAVASRISPEGVARHRLPGGGEPRSLLEARFFWGDHRFTLFNTHLALRPVDRLRQVETIARRVRGMPGPKLVLGDWNCTPDSEDVRILLDAGLRLCSEGHQPTFPAVNPRLTLDYIAVSPEWEIRGCSPHPSQASDHLPLLAELALP